MNFQEWTEKNSFYLIVNCNSVFKKEYCLFYALGGLFLIYGKHILKPIYSQLSWG